MYVGLKDRDGLFSFRLFCDIFILYRFNIHCILVLIFIIEVGYLCVYLRYLTGVSEILVMVSEILDGG